MTSGAWTIAPNTTEDVASPARKKNTTLPPTIRAFRWSPRRAGGDAGVHDEDEHQQYREAGRTAVQWTGDASEDRDGFSQKLDVPQTRHFTSS